MDINITKNANGSLELSTIHNGYRVHKTYYFYSTRAAKADFINYLRGL